MQNTTQKTTDNTNTTKNRGVARVRKHPVINRIGTFSTYSSSFEEELFKSIPHKVYSFHRESNDQHHVDV